MMKNLNKVALMLAAGSLLAASAAFADGTVFSVTIKTPGGNPLVLSNATLTNYVNDPTDDPALDSPCNNLIPMPPPCRR